MRDPMVSIGLPVYNAERFLGEALNSLLGQEYSDFELVISDNASTDGTAQLCQEYIRIDSRVRYSRSPENRGVAANFNNVLQSARGKYFMWAAHDDLWDPAFLRVLIEISSDPNIALAFCAFDNIDSERRSVRSYPYVADLPCARTYERLKRYLQQDERLGKANLIYGLMPRSVLTKTGGLRAWTSRDWGMDMHTVFKVLSFGDLGLSPEVLFHKRLAPCMEGAPLHGGHGIGQQQSKPTYERALDRIAYMLGYLRLIETIEPLTRNQKFLLILTVCMKAVNLVRSKFIPYTGLQGNMYT